MSKRVFLLGAGFSRLAGLPLASDLWHFVLDYLKNSRDMRDTGSSGFYKELLHFTEKIEVHYPWLLENVELLFTYIDLAHLHGNLGIFKKFFNDFAKLRIFRWRLSGALYRTIRYKHDEFRSVNRKITEQHKNANKIYWWFCKQLNNSDTVITYNYDLIVEIGLWLQNKWTFLDGYGILKKIESFQSNGIGYPPKKPTHSSIKIYKLHGSLGWFYDEQNEDIIFGEINDSFDDYFGNYYENNRSDLCVRHDEGTTFIEPSFVKLFNRRILLDIWAKAFQEILKADELIIIGYSLPYADSAAITFLSSSIRCSNISNLKVVNPNPMVYAKFENLFNRKIISESYKFEDWIEQHMC